MPQYLDFSFPPRDLHSSRVFPTNKWPRACSRTVNGKDLTHRDSVLFAFATVIDAENKSASRGNIGAESATMMKNHVVKMGRTSREYSPMRYIR